MYGCVKDCLILIPLRPPQISCFTLSLKYFSSDPDSCSHVGIRHQLQFSHPPRAGPGLLTLLPPPPSSFILLNFVVLYIPSHGSCTPVRSQLVFCKHFCVWRCIPDVSVERNVLHVQLLFCHLFISTFWLLEIKLLWTFMHTSLGKHVLHIVRWPWVLDLKQESSTWRKGKCIQCSLTDWRQCFQTGN